jgi:hypothetical protein
VATGVVSPDRQPEQEQRQIAGDNAARMYRIS